MYFSYNNYSVVLLFFFFQGILFAGLLLRRGLLYEDQASKWLSFFSVLCALYIAPFMLGYAGWYSDNGYRDFMFFMPMQHLFLIGPVIYFYTQSLLRPSFRLSLQRWLHFLPAVLYILYSLIMFVADCFLLSEYYFYADGRDRDLDYWYQVTGLLSMLIYLSLSLRYYTRYKRRALDTVSFADAILFKWIQRFLIAFLGILILRILMFVFNPEWGAFGDKFWHYLSFSILFFYIAMSGYTHAVKSEMVSKVGYTGQQMMYLPEEVFSSIHDEVAQTNSEIDNQLDEASLEIWKEKLTALMREDKIYERPNLTLQDISKRLEEPPKMVSRIVNQGFEKNFNDFINLHRVEAVIENFKSGAHQKKTLLGIAYDCGFNSKATFNRAFKKHTSLTPRQYLAKMEA